MARPVPPLLAPRSSDEYAPLPPGRAQARAGVRASEVADASARAVALDARSYLRERRGTAATLRAIDEAAGGGFSDVPPEAELDESAAAAAFAGDGAVVDVQTHLVRPSRTTVAADALFGFLRMVDPDRWGAGIDAARLSAASVVS